MIDLTFGRPGECKSLDMAQTTIWLLERAIKIKKKLNLKREVWLNFHLSNEVLEKYKDFIFYYDDLHQLIEKKDIDIVIDEVSVYLPCDRWKDTHFEVRRMLAQHRKRGLEIYANTQDYKMIDINFRRMIRYVYVVKKLCGNRDPSNTMPPIKYIWGIYTRREIDVSSLENEKESAALSFPKFKLIRREYCEIYDTREDIKPGKPPKFKHIARECADCSFRKVSHL